MTRKTWSIVVGGLAVLVALSVFVSASRDRHTDNPAEPTYVPTATIKDLMDAVVDPSADDVWNAVQTTVQRGGPVETVPVTAEDWAKVRRGAIRLVEATNLLIIPGRHMARPGEKSETPGVELEPEQMEALVNQDRVAWNQRAKALHDVSLEVMRAIDAKDAAQLFEVGGKLDSACENCHKQYWYPNEHIPEFPTNVTPTAPASKG